MARSYSTDIRERVAGEVEAGQSRRAAARRFGVSASTGVRIAKRKELTGSVEPARIGRPAGSGKLTIYASDLIGWVETDKDITMPELAAKLEEKHGVTAHPASLSRFLLKQGFTVKKNAAGNGGRTR
jgi:transposase